MSLIYQIAWGEEAEDFNAGTPNVILRVPCPESVKIVEYGFLSVDVDPGVVGVLALQYLDAAGNATTLNSFTVPAAATVDDLVSQRLDVLLDKSGNTTVTSISGTPGTLVSEADGITAFQLSITTAFGAGMPESWARAPTRSRSARTRTSW